MSRYALCAWLLAIVATGGGSSPVRLLVLVLPLLVFSPSVQVLAVATFVAALPSILEWSLYGDWIGSLGLRVFLLAAFIAGCFGFALGLQLRARRDLRQTFASALPWFSAAMLVHALCRQFELIPAHYQYLSGNHQAALITLIFAFVFALEMTSFWRRNTIILLLMALVGTGSRWGIFVGVLVCLILGLMAYRGRGRWLLSVVTGLWFCSGVWALSFTSLTKGTIIRALMPLITRRPLSGIGPGGVETLDLQYRTRYIWQFRQTHAESLPIDWMATFGIPVSMVLLITLLALIFWRVSVPSDHPGRFPCHYLALGLLGVLLHDLLDFSLTSGAVSLFAAVAIGAIAPDWQWLKRPIAWWGKSAVVVALFGLLLASYHYNPLAMERERRLETVSEKWGRRTFRYWINKSLATNETTQRISALSRALELAPGDPYLWFRLGTYFLESGNTSQAVQAYRSGLSTVPLKWTSPKLQSAFSAPPKAALAVVDGHLGASRMLANYYAVAKRPPIEAMVTLSVANNDGKIDEKLLQALMRVGRPKSLVVPELWRLILRGRLEAVQVHRALGVLSQKEPKALASGLLLRLVESDPRYCTSLAYWDLERLHELLSVATALRRICWRSSIGNSAVLRRLSVLSGLEQ